jgi:SNF2 family DNA or RNA helicase
MQLLKDQKASKTKLEQMKVGAFFMEAGTGKTRPCIELVNEINPDYVLYLAPYQCINTDNEQESTLHEINKWGGFNCDFDLMGIESLQNSDRIYLELYNKLSKAKKGVIIIDESLKIKNSEAKRTNRIITLGNMVEYKYILNGTPLSRNLLDLWSQMSFLSHSILNMSEAEFKNNFCEYKKLTIHKPGTYRSRSREWIVKYHNLDYLYKLIEPYVFRSDLQLDVNLQEIQIDFELSEDEMSEHRRIIDEILSDEWLMAKPNFFLNLTQKLQNNYSRNQEKFDLTSDILKREPKTLVVAKYIETQELLKTKFPNARILSWQKHAHGLNLQNYNEMLLFDQHWDYALYDQIKRRIYRTGQKQDCIVRRLKGNCGLENMIWQNIDKKSDLLQEFKKLTLEEFKKKAV